jgi:UDP-4-amino-4,6-dideoxy-N-acetyl-beta-L-altrosamine N-acetyltransferase
MYSDHTITGKEHAAWLEHALQREDASYWVMTCDGEDVGFASVTDISDRHGTGSWALYIGEESARRKGMGAFVTYTILTHVFDDLGLRKLSCEVLATNNTALTMYESFGFVREGLFREQILKAGGAVDVHRLGILDREWRQIEEAQRQRLLTRGILTA